MTNYNSTANYIFNLVVQVLVTAYLTREMLLHGRVGWAVTLILVNLAAIGINLYIWLNVKKGRFSAQKIKQGRLTILVILLVSLLCLAVVSRTARVSPENPTVSAAIGQIVPQSDKTKCISVKRKGNTTFAEAEKGSRDFSAMAAGWTFATTIKDDAAEEFWAVLEKTELTPHINAFTLTCLYPYRQRHQVPGAVPAGLGRYRYTDAVPRSYCGRADLDLPGACPAAVCTRLPGAVSGRQRWLPGPDTGLFRHFGGTPRLITLIPRHRQTVAALIFRVTGVPLHPHKFHLMIL